MSDESQTGVAHADGSFDAVEAMWHATIDGAEVGPLTRDAVRAMLEDGRLARDAQVRRDGDEDYGPMARHPELAIVLEELAAHDAVPCPPEDALLAEAPPSPVPESAPLEGALFAARPSEAPAVSEVPARDAHARPLFASPSRPAPAMPVISSAEARTAGARARTRRDHGPDEAPFTGARNEDSVLFSEATREEMVRAAEKQSQRPPPPTQETSGLIDISRLAPVIETNGSARRTETDQLLTVGAASPISLPPPAAARTLLAPAVPAATVSLPPAPAPSLPAPAGGGVNKTVVLSSVLVALIVTAGIGTVQVLLHRQDPEPRAPVEAPRVAAAPAPPPALPAPTPVPHTYESAAPAPPAPSRPAVTAPSPVAAAPARPAAPSRPARPRATAPAPTTAAPSVRPSRPAAPAAPAPGNGDLPETPARSDVAGAMNLVAPIVRACGGGAGGRATVEVIFASSGRATTSSVRAPHAGTPAGSCIARAVRSARLPQFSRPTLTVVYAFDL